MTHSSQRAGQVDEAEKEENLWKKVEERLLCLQHPPNAGPLLAKAYYQA
jgi:hypothetical protein